MIDIRRKVNAEISANESAGTTGTVVGTGIAAQGNEGIAFTLNVTEATGLTSATMGLEVSDDNSAYVAATFDEVAADVDGDLTVALTDVGSVKIGYTGNKAYVRPTVVLVATDVDFNVLGTSTPQFTATPIAIPGN